MWGDAEEALGLGRGSRGEETRGGDRPADEGGGLRDAGVAAAAEVEGFVVDAQLAPFGVADEAA